MKDLRPAIWSLFHGWTSHRIILTLTPTLLTTFLLITFFKQNDSLGNQQRDPTLVKRTSPSNKTLPSRTRADGAKVMSAWDAFAVYHPKAQLNDEALFLNFRMHSAQTPQLLGARALLPILRATFGDQARGNLAAERDPWFLTHPTSLFNPDQLRSLCGTDAEQMNVEGWELCWKPKFSDAYIATLTDFAADACPQFVTKEMNQADKSKNKLILSDEFEEENLESFAYHWLKIPKDTITKEWLNRIVAESKKVIQSSDDTALVESTETEPVKEDLYSLSCQAMLMSEEFYSR